MLAVVAVLLALASAAPAAASPRPGTPQALAATKGKIHPKLKTQLAKRARVDFWVHFEARTDLTKARAIKDWNERGAAVARALRQTADASQAAVRKELTGAGVTYQSFWATNAIKVSQGTPELAEQLASRVSVDALLPSFTVEAPHVTRSTAQRALDTVEWGIANINADDVWNDFGVRGEGITIASIDTGVQFDHPALVRQYRGNNGDGGFDHDYNWFDAAGACRGAPCDTDGHGTHTMGTMVGDDGVNRIGAAPGARWITANGCCPSDAALIASGQWMLEPTDLQGQNPDASKRPHIVNNSWGSQEPTNEPIMEDISAAWTASGIFGVWANGNSGPGCQTSGSPGSRTINYSVGAYDATNTIADFSSRGAGQDGETKPNIAAPGANVRSSVPGSGYDTYNGTSMAAPHVAGAIALAWSAAGSLVGDVAGTKDLLDGTATDNPDGQCGGTDDDNNVFGEGRLDALTLVRQAPVGPTGRVAGTVTNAETGQPVPGVTITITGPVDRMLTTGADGTYQSGALPVGGYTLTTKKYGYATRTAAAQVSEGATTTVDLALSPQPMSTVSGTVTDGSGQGWPLYARITIDSYPGGPIFTDPVTGRYSVRLANAAEYTMHVSAQYDGYQVVDRTFALGTSDLVVDVAVPVVQGTCTAPGYRWNGTSEDFNDWTDAGTQRGWTTSGQRSWRFDNPGHRPPPDGGDGRFAIADSAFDSGKRLDATLTSPAINLSGQDSPQLMFDTSYYPDGTSQRADVEVSVDGGKTWKAVWQQNTGHALGRVVVLLPQAAGRDAVRVRFHYQGRNAWWWAVDNVFVGTRTCVPVDGGLVVGMVSDRDDGAAVFATVARAAQPKEFGTGVTTPADPNVGDGLYWLFSSTVGPTEFSATAAGYQAAKATVVVSRNAVVAHDWSLTPTGG